MVNRTEYQKQYRLANKEKLKQYRMDNKEKIKEYQKQYNKQYRLANKEKIKEQKKQYRLANKEKIKQYRMDNKEKINQYNRQYRKANKELYEKYYHDNKEKILSQLLVRRYGITLEERDQMILKQDNKCARCHLPFEGIGTERLAPVIDHDHSFPKGDPNSVRSIVHNICNLMMGSHNDSIEDLQLSIVYLKKFSKVT